MRYAATILLVGFSVGCTSVDSSAVDTSGIYADLSVDATGDGTSTVWAFFHEGDATSTVFLALSGGDAAHAYMEVLATEFDKDMIETSLFGATGYSADFDNASGEVSFRVKLDRSATGKVSAPSSVVTLPAPFSIVAPASNTSFSRTTGTITIDWNPYNSGELMSYEITGSCIQDQAAGISSDTGHLQIGPNDILSLSGHESESCDIIVTIDRYRNGTVDPAYGHGGVFKATQERQINLHVTP